MLWKVCVILWSSYATPPDLASAGYAFLDKSLFTTFQHRTTSRPSSSSSQGSSSPLHNTIPPFEISFPALLETLQIFGLTDTTNPNRQPWARERDPYTTTPAAFASTTLGIAGLCRLEYASLGSPLSVIIEDAPGRVTTTCNLKTYEPSHEADIPFSRDALALKVIMKASWLFDAVTELASTSPERLTLTASSSQPNFTLSASGPLGSADVTFSKDSAPGGGVLETFQVARPRVTNTYKFSLIKAAARAMQVATKASIRGDEQGVLSLQFMIEIEPGKVSFVDFRFVPFVKDEGEEAESERDRHDDAEEDTDDEE